MEKKELWINLKGYHFDDLVPPNLWGHITEAFGVGDASTRAFAVKIARKSGWKILFALKAIKKYKKFVFLGVTSDFAVTPSKVIDQVWHEHLLFTKAYRHFCSEVIRHNFDHNPELIPVADQTIVFNAQYMDTLDLYKKEFGIEPPASIWGISKFDPDKVVDANYKPLKKRTSDKGYTYYEDSTPLYMYFDMGQTDPDYPEFNAFDGGSGGNWESNDIFHESGGHSGPDSTDSGGHGSDSGSGGDSGGDGGGCSSGCGGGCSS